MNLEKTIIDYKKEMLARFITGDADLESEWGTYVDTMNQMGLERYAQIIQEAYDASQK